MPNDANIASGSRERLGQVASTGPLIDLRVSLSDGPWRIGPAWAVLAGVLAGGTPLFDGDALLGLVGAVVLADAAWGSVWQLTRSSAVTTVDNDTISALPYAQIQSPASRMVRGFRNMASGRELGATWHGPIVGLALAVGLSVMLGGPALVLSLVALLATVAAWTFARQGIQPAFLYAFLGVGLPWILGAMLAGGTTVLPTSWPVGSLALGTAFVMLQWGINRANLMGHGSTLGIWFGQGIVLVVLAALREPATLAIVGSLFAPPCWWLLKDGARRVGMVEELTRGGPWWLAAMLLAAISTR